MLWECFLARFVRDGMLHKDRNKSDAIVIISAGQGP